VSKSADRHSCGIDYDGKGWCGVGVDQSRPLPVLATGAFNDLWVDDEASCLRSTTGWSCWGHGYLGATPLSSSTPTPVPALAELTIFSQGAGHLCGLDVNQRVRCVGADDQGQAGDGVTLQPSTPLLVLPP
jgi:hypothetical protein